MSFCTAASIHPFPNIDLPFPALLALGLECFLVCRCLRSDAAAGFPRRAAVPACLSWPFQQHVDVAAGIAECGNSFCNACKDHVTLSRQLHMKW